MKFQQNQSASDDADEPRYLVLAREAHAQRLDAGAGDCCLAEPHTA